MADSLSSLAGALADCYPIERELGRGGNAVFYLAPGSDVTAMVWQVKVDIDLESEFFADSSLPGAVLDATIGRESRSERPGRTLTPSEARARFRVQFWAEPGRHRYE